MSDNCDSAWYSSFSDPGQEGAPVDIILDLVHVLDLTEGQEADLTAATIDADTVIAILLCLLVGVMLATE